MSHYREPVKHTCPKIDNVINSIKEVFEACKYASKSENLDEIKDCISDIENYLWHSTSIMEELRSANDSLRDWGSNEADKVDELESENEDLKDRISNLEITISELREIANEY